MPDIRPFRGFLYNPDKVKNIARVVTEPYDVISPPQQKLYYKSHPYNIIRLILGKRYPTDNNKNNQYTRARKFFLDWQKRDILLRDKKENIYIYTQSFSYNNRIRTRTGFIVLLKLEDCSKNTILPHENTDSKAVEDRLKLLKAVEANLSPIFALFCDSQGRVNRILSQYKSRHPPCIVIRKDRILHRLWRMGDRKNISIIKSLLKGRQIFIADGHHRYEAALNYKMQMQKKDRYIRSSASFNYIMTYLVATTDPGLTILPTHRVIRVVGNFKLAEIVKKLKRTFQIYKFYSAAGLFSYMDTAGARCVFGAYFGRDRFYGLELKDAGCKDLDVVILRNLIIEPISSLSPFEKATYYTRDAQEAINLVKRDRCRIAFFLKPASIKQVKRIASAGQRMPYKSTYFYPKLLTGLVMNAF